MMTHKQTDKQTERLQLYLHPFINLAYFCVFVGLFESNKRQNGWTDRAQILCETSRDPGKGFWMIKILKNFVLKSFLFL